MASVSPRIGYIAAKKVAASGAIDMYAAKVKAMVLAQIAPHTYSTQLAASTHIRRSKIDRLVVSDDPTAWHKEFGHQAPNGAWVPGIFAFTNAARKAAK